MAGDHVCALGQKTLAQHPKLLLLQLSGAEGQETLPYERKLVSNCLLRELLVYMKPNDKIKRILVSFQSSEKKELSLSFIALGTSFDMGIALDRCSLQTHLSGFSSELFDVLLLGWERQSQTLMRIVYIH